MGGSGQQPVAPCFSSAPAALEDTLKTESSWTLLAVFLGSGRAAQWAGWLPFEPGFKSPASCSTPPLGACLARCFGAERSEAASKANDPNLQLQVRPHGKHNGLSPAALLPCSGARATKPPFQPVRSTRKSARATFCLCRLPAALVQLRANSAAHRLAKVLQPLARMRCVNQNLIFKLILPAPNTTADVAVAHQGMYFNDGPPSHPAKR